MANENLALNLYNNNIFNYPDLLKNFLFLCEFHFNENSSIANIIRGIENAHGYGNGSIGETLILRARSISLPKKTTNKINTHFMGQLRNYPGRTKVDGDVTIKFDEFQDLALQDIFFEWQNAIFNHGVPNGYAASKFSIGRNGNTDGIEAGGAVGDFLSMYTATINIKMYDSALKTPLPFEWTLFDVFPTDNGNVQLDAEGENKVSPEVTFNYNTWTMQRTGTH